MAKHVKEKPSVFHSGVVKSTLKIVLIVTVTASLLLNLFTFIMPIMKYYSNSMTPTLKDGQILIVSKMTEIERGDIIAFYYNNKVIVRRVVAAGNDRVAIDVFVTVTVSGEEIADPYVQNRMLGQCNLDFPYNVPSNALFVLGDDRAIAMDSRRALANLTEGFPFDRAYNIYNFTLAKQQIFRYNKNSIFTIHY